MGIFDFLKKKNVTSSNERPLEVTPKITISSSVQVSQEEVIPIEKIIRGKKPTCDGLYPHEILVLSYAPKFCESGNKFQGFWWYKYGIKDVQDILDSLMKRGYIQHGTITDAINMEKIPTIKAELQKRSLAVSGKKEDLVNRLVNNVLESDLSVAFSRRPYSLTETGEKILKKYEWIPFIHNHEIEGLGIWSLTEMMETPPYTNYRDKIWSFLNQRGIEHIRNNNFGLYRNARFTMSEFVADEGKTKTAFSLLCEVITYDLSGLSNDFQIKFLDIESRHYFPYEKSIVTMAPGITSRIKKFAEEFGWTDTELRSQLITEMKKIELPFRLFTVEECADIVIAEIHKDQTNLKEIYSIAEKRFKKQYVTRRGI